VNTQKAAFLKLSGYVVMCDAVCDAVCGAVCVAV